MSSFHHDSLLHYQEQVRAPPWPRIPAGASLGNVSTFLYSVAHHKVRSLDRAWSGHDCLAGTPMWEHSCTVAPHPAQVILGGTTCHELHLLSSGRNTTWNPSSNRCFLNINPAGDKAPIPPSNRLRIGAVSYPFWRKKGLCFFSPSGVFCFESPMLLYFQTSNSFLSALQS